MSSSQPKGSAVHAPEIPINSPALDLSDAEFDELDELLASTPEALEPCDVVMLDGFLCGVLVQPILIEPAAWMPHVFDFEGRPLPDDADPKWLQRTQALIMRRHAALNRAIVDDGWFDPMILEFDDSEPVEDDPQSEALAGLSAVSRSLAFWVSGFERAMASFPDLAELPDDSVHDSLDALLRHLPAETDEQRKLVAELDAEHPLASIEDAVEDLVAHVCDLEQSTREARYHVDTVRRDAPKVGRNDACPCGSGKKFKHCHGA